MWCSAVSVAEAVFRQQKGLQHAEGPLEAHRHLLKSQHHRMGDDADAAQNEVRQFDHAPRINVHGLFEGTRQIAPQSVEELIGEGPLERERSGEGHAIAHLPQMKRKFLGEPFA